MVRPGGECDGWDLEIRLGAAGGARVLTAVEEHGAGRQLVRARARPIVSRTWLGSAGVLGALAVAAGLDAAWLASGLLAGAALVPVARIAADCGSALAAVRSAWRTVAPAMETSPEATVEPAIERAA